MPRSARKEHGRRRSRRRAEGRFEGGAEAHERYPRAASPRPGTARSSAGCLWGLGAGLGLIACFSHGPIVARARLRGAMFVPLTYWTDGFVYRRWQRGRTRPARPARRAEPPGGCRGTPSLDSISCRSPSTRVVLQPAVRLELLRRLAPRRRPREAAVVDPGGEPGAAPALELDRLGARPRGDPRHAHRRRPRRGRRRARPRRPAPRSGCRPARRRRSAHGHDPRRAAGRAARSRARRSRTATASTVAGIEFEVVGIPGHSVDHVAFCADGELFSGDLLFARLGRPRRLPRGRLAGAARLDRAPARALRARGRRLPRPRRARRRSGASSRRTRSSASSGRG